MLKIKELFRQYAIPCSFLVFCLFLLVYRGVGALFAGLPQTMLCSFLAEAVNIIWPVALTVLCGYGFALGLKGFGETLKAGIAALIFYTVILLCTCIVAVWTPGTQWQSLPGVLLGVLLLVGIGIREELIFRGIIANALTVKYGKTGRGLWFSVVLSALFFGAAHLPNIFSGVEGIGLIAQLIAAAGAGLLFTAIYLRGGNIWVLVILHGVIDASGLFTSVFTVSEITHADDLSGMNLIGALITLVLMVGLSLFLLRKKKQPAVFARLEALRGEALV